MLVVSCGGHPVRRCRSVPVSGSAIRKRLQNFTLRLFEVAAAGFFLVR